MASYEIIHVHLQQMPNSLALRKFQNTAFHGHEQAGRRRWAGNYEINSTYSYILMKRHEMRKIQINTLLRLAVQAGLHDTIFSYRRRQNKGDLPETPRFRNRILSLLPQGVAKTRISKANTERRENLPPISNRRGLLSELIKTCA